MDPINSWLDREQVRKLAELLTGQPPTPPPPPTPDAEPAPPSADSAIENRPALQAPTPDDSAQPLPDAPPSQGRLIYHIHRFRDWLHQRHPVLGLFVLDHEGQVVFDEGDCENLHFLARHAGTGGNFHTKVGPAAVVEIIPLDTPAGRLVMGAVVEKPLTDTEVSDVTEVLRMIPFPPAQPASPHL